MESKSSPPVMDAGVCGGYSKAQSQKQVWIQAWGSQDLLGQSTMPKKSQWLRLFASTWLFFGIPVLQPFTHVCNFPPASTGIKKPWDALQNNPFGAQCFCSVTVSISAFSSFNIKVKFLIYLLNTSLNSYAMSQFRGFKSSIKMTPRLGSIGPQRDAKQRQNTLKETFFSCVFVPLWLN